MCMQEKILNFPASTSANIHRSVLEDLELEHEIFNGDDLLCISINLQRIITEVVSMCLKIR